MGQAAERLEMQENGRFLKLHQFFGFNPLEFPICARTPKRHGVISAWVGHIPFAMCLVAMIKPRVLVELGTHWGVSYCTFCQAVKEMRLDTQCYAVDTWQGDPHAGFYSSEVLADLKGYHDKEYALFSELIQSCFDDALPRFSDRSIDLLHIDGLHTYEAVKHDFETWLPKVSDRGVILFHDTDVRDRESFGVWRFWDEIKQKYPHFEFYHMYGLGVLAAGESLSEELQPFLGAPKAEADRVREYFQNLGDHLTNLFNVSMQKSNLQELLHAKVDECSQLQAQLHARADECSQLQAQLHARADECSQLQAQLHARADECSQLQAQLHARADECSRMGEELSHLRNELDSTRQFFSHLRFRAVNKVAIRLGRFPQVYRLLRFVVRTAAAARRSLLYARRFEGCHHEHGN